MFYRFLLASMIMLLSALTQAIGQTGLYTYNGGYFLRNGSHWEEYRPDAKPGVWATYEQYNEEANFFNIKNSLCYVSVPKTTSCNFFYAGMSGHRYIRPARYMTICPAAPEIFIAMMADIS